jgi:hypothetical protein
VKPFLREATRREKRRLRITLIVCVIAAALGIALYVWGRDYAYEQRGYLAYGGEMFFLGIPIFAAYKIVRSIWEYITDRKEEPSC